MIYKLNKKSLGKEILKFGKTEYGKIQFLLPYILFFIQFIGVIVLLVEAYRHPSMKVFFLLYPLIVCTLITFVLGSIHYYKELRIFVNENK